MYKFTNKEQFVKDLHTLAQHKLSRGDKLVRKELLNAIVSACLIVGKKTPTAIMDYLEEIKGAGSIDGFTENIVKGNKVGTRTDRSKFDDTQIEW